MAIGRAWPRCRFGKLGLLFMIGGEIEGTYLGSDSLILL